MQVPISLLNALKDIKGFDKEAFEKVHADEQSITSIRFNPFKKENDADLMGKNLKPVPWSSAGYYLPQRPSFTFDPLFHGGLYYVQEASSMFLEQALKQTVNLSKPLKVLDLCAAPGGKSTLIQSLLSAESLLVSNEVIRTRVNVLEENIVKWGAANIVVTNSDPKDFQKLTDFFDVILIDAPCSGSGLFRRDPTAVKEWSTQNVELCCQRQQRILADVLPALKQDGILIYSTCSYSPQENEEIVDWLVNDLSMQSCTLTIKEDWGIVETITPAKGYGYRFYPDKVQGEGFFIAALKKNSSSGSFYYRNNKFEKISKQEEELLKEWIKDITLFQYIKFKNEMLAMPASWDEECLSVLSLMHIKKAGIKIGEVMNGALVPHHQLALANVVNDNVPRLELNKEEAIHYLKKETIQADVPAKGWMLVCYKGVSLGWIKVLPNRINNYYPKEWRILKQGV